MKVQASKSVFRPILLHGTVDNALVLLLAPGSLAGTEPGHVHPCVLRYMKSGDSGYAACQVAAGLGATSEGSSSRKQLGDTPRPQCRRVNVDFCAAE